MPDELAVGEALEQGLLGDARLLAGAQGLDRIVRYVTIMDAPDIVDWLLGEEMLCSNIYLLRDDPDAQVRLVERLAGHNTSALVIKRRWVTEVPPGMFAVADEARLPLIEVPNQVRWIEVMGPVMAAIQNRTLALAQHATAAHQELTNACLTGGGFAAIAATLARFVGNPVAILDKWHEVLAVAPPGEETVAVEQMLRDAAARFLKGSGDPISPDHSSWYRVQVPAPEPGSGEHRVVLAPLTSTGQMHGIVAILEANRRITGRDLAVLVHGCTTASLEFRKQSELQQLQRKLSNDFLRDLLTGSIDSRETLTRRARSMGWHLDGTFFLLICDIDRFESYYLQFPPEVGDSRILDLKEQFVRAVRRYWPNPDVPFMEESDSVVVILSSEMLPSAGHGEPLADLARRLCDYVSGQLPDVTVSVGLAAMAREAVDLPISLREAQMALRLGRKIQSRKVVMRYDQLGLFRLLESVPGPALKSFFQETVEPLLAYDAQHGTELLKTLETYFLCHESIDRTSRKLHIHPNTLKYRMRKVEDLTRLNTHRAEDKFNLYAGLKVMAYHRTEWGKQAGS